MSEPIATPLRAEPEAKTLAKATAALAPGYRYLLKMAPPMPPDFYGEVRFTFRAGQFVLATVEETLKA